MTSITGLLVLGYILELLRRQQLREKYAAIWLAIGLLVAPLGFVPDLLDPAARRLGVASGASLVLFVGFVLVLLVSLHLSWETSRLEAETRTLAEDVALIKAHLVQQGGYPGHVGHLGHPGTLPQRTEDPATIEAQVNP